MIVRTITIAFNIITNPKKALNFIIEIPSLMQGLLFILFTMLIESLQIHMFHPSLIPYVTEEITLDWGFGIWGDFIISYILGITLLLVPAVILTLFIAKLFNRGTTNEFRIFFVSLCFIMGTIGIIVTLFQTILSWIIPSVLFYKCIEWLSSFWVIILAIILIRQVYAFSFKKTLIVLVVVTLISVPILGVILLGSGYTFTRFKYGSLKRNVAEMEEIRERTLITEVHDILTRERRTINLKATVKWRFIPLSGESNLESIARIEEELLRQFTEIYLRKNAMKFKEYNDIINHLETEITKGVLAGLKGEYDKVSSIKIISVKIDQIP